MYIVCRADWRRAHDKGHAGRRHQEVPCCAVIASQLTCSGARFTNGADKALVSTDISSRGIDVPTVSLVVNFDLPFLRTNQGEVPRELLCLLSLYLCSCVYDATVLETYVHRIGRTGRFSRRGTAISLVDANKGFDMRMLSELQRHYKMKIEQVCASKEDLQTHIEGK